MSESRAWRFLLLVGVPALLLAYANTLHNSFHYDDYHSIVENPSIRDLSRAADLLTRPSTFSGMPERAMFRPLVTVSYALNYRLGGYRVEGYHLVNLGLHLGCSLLVVALGAQLGLGAWPAVAAGLLFGLHPVQAEVVNYISSRSESLAALGYLGSAAAYLRWRTGRRTGWAVASSASLAAGLLAKATAVTLPLAIAAGEAAAARGPGAGKRTVPARLLAALGCLTLAYLVAVRTFAGAALGSPVRPLATQVWTQVKAAPFYAWLAVMPVRLSVEHPFQEAATPWQPAVLAALAALASGAVVAVALWRGRHFRSGLLLLAGAVLVALPASLVPLNVLVNEHRLYLSLAFLSLLVVECFGLPGVALSRAPGGREPGIRGSGGPAGGWGLWAAVALAVVFGVLSFQRNRLWQNELTLWGDAVAKAPAAYRAHLHLGGAQEASGDLAAALGSYRRAAELAPQVAETHYDLANGLRLAGRVEEARAAYERSLALAPEFAPALINLAALEQDAGGLGAAEALLGRAARAWPGSAEVQRRLGVVRALQTRPTEAAAAYGRALALDPGMAEAHYNLGNLHFAQGRLAEAAASYRQALDR
ncbi:MAG: tetratricopeptide repeat protein, partial [Gemmatimonadota bacterium]